MTVELAQAIDNTQDGKAQFHPSHSVFVSANAGSGKTSLLTRRVLSLLMHGVEPSKILCLTFTNGAAAEMTDRITKTLGSWVMMDEGALEHELLAFMQAPIHPEMMARARRLFAIVLDAPVGLRLQTIHAFCQSLLARFPLEAGVGMHLQVMDDSTQAALLREARMQLFARAGEEDRKTLYRLVQQLGEYSLLDMLAEIIRHKRKLTRFIDAHHGLGFATQHIYTLFGVEYGLEFRAFEPLPRGAEHLALLRDIASVLSLTKSAVNKKTARILAAWASLPEVTEDGLAGYLQAYFDAEKNQPRGLFTKGVLSPAQEELLRVEAEIMVPLAVRFFHWRDANYTASLLGIGARLLEYYEALKDQHGLMDFDDQILAATRLLTQNHVGAWVMYKLDGGIDHVLVDEAQDTSPEQWEIVRAITSEFFAGQGRRAVDRSLFVVGDEKQSIFRFQGADPAGLAINRAHFMQLLNAAGMPSSNLSLTHSYRSAPEILQVVDQVFASEAARNGLSAVGDAPRHESKRVGAKGYAELWPITHGDDERRAELMLARQLAERIQGWVLAGANPGDVMVLVRTRKRFPHVLSRALKRLGIPVAGVDRMELLDNLAVQDLLAFAQILLLPDDDLTLAALLKSPLFGMGEELLFAISHGRQGSLWEALGGHEQCRAAYELLAEFRGKVDFVSPYALFCELLDARGHRRAFTGRMGEETHDVLDIFLEQALLYERDHIVSMQGFLGWMQAGVSEVKRDMEHAGGQVRIMTVHGSKGLQAKIVVVADTTSLPSQKDMLQWHGESPCAAMASKEASAVVRAAKQRESEMELEQYRRLLYVALTRAEDMLVVCGAAYRSNSGYQDESWYQLVLEAFAALGQLQEDGRRIFGTMPEFTRNAVAAVAAFSPKLYGAAPDELDPPRPLSPSQLEYDAPAAASPTINPALIDRGIAMHRMLQYLPPLGDARQQAARVLAASHAPSLDAPAREALVAEAMAILESSEFAPLFGPESMAEVPVSGMIDWQGRKMRVVGQVDRLAVVGNDVWVVDYKSSATLPLPGRLPARYVQQMGLYCAVLKEIYPHHRIRAGLLWTAGPRMDWLDETAFATYI